MDTFDALEARSATPSELQPSAAAGDDLDSVWSRVVTRRSFLARVGVVGVAAAVPAGALLAGRAAAARNELTDGDVGVLRFLAAAEIIESDLWQQYNELGGAAGGNPAYI